MNLIQLLLPLHDNDGRSFPAHPCRQVRADLTEHSGGVTAFIRASAVGLWPDDAKDIDRDDVVMFEVLAKAHRYVLLFSQIRPSIDVPTCLARALSAARYFACFSYVELPS